MLKHDRSILNNCPTCSKGYRNKTDLKYHIAFEHDKTEEFKCDTCEKAFQSPDVLKKHIRSIHEEERFKYQCELCSKSYFDSSFLKKHVQKIHEGIDLSVKCPLCDKSLCKDTLKRHIADVHEKKKPHECDICYEKFAQSGQLKTHKKGKHKMFMQ